MKIKAANTILYCKHWQETVAFYRDGIKLLVLSSNEWFVEFKLNESARLSVANDFWTTIKSGEGRGITISLEVADVVQVQTDLSEAGISSTPIKEFGGKGDLCA